MTGGKARAPGGKRIYAIGDIHGCVEQLRDLLQQIAEDAALAPATEPATGPVTENVLVTLGDYVDRGPDSRGVLEILASGALPGFTRVHLRGNHDAMMLDFLSNPDSGTLWLMNGGDATCRSYGLEPTALPVELCRALRQALPEAHLAFLRSLGLTHVEGDYLFVHAGLLPGRALAEQDPEDLMWIRDPFLYSTEDHGYLVVHGHTPVSRPDRQANRIGIDTGACYGGDLTCLVLQDQKQRFLRA